MGCWKARLGGRALLLAALVGVVALGGCLGPDYAAIDNQLRDRNLKLEQDLGKVEGALKDSQATIGELRKEAERNTPRVATLPEATLADMFTVGRVAIRKTTDAWDLQGGGVQDGFRVFVRTTTADGIILPATGKLTVQAVELPVGKPPVDLGEWAFTAKQLKERWYGGFGLDQLGLNCPWKVRPSGNEVTFKVQFVDGLTGRVFTDQTVVKVHLKDKG